VLGEDWPIDTTGGPHVSDVPTNNPFYQYIETAFNHALISGYPDGTFRWGSPITRGQLCKFIVLAQSWPIDTTGGPHFSDVLVDNTFYRYIETAYNHGIISGYANGKFRPGYNATRGQISKIVYNALTQVPPTSTATPIPTNTAQPIATGTPITPTGTWTPYTTNTPGISPTNVPNATLTATATGTPIVP
jgi:S-layer homology domain